MYITVWETEQKHLLFTNNSSMQNMFYDTMKITSRSKPSPMMMQTWGRLGSKRRSHIKWIVSRFWREAATELDELSVRLPSFAWNQCQTQHKCLRLHVPQATQRLEHPSLAYPFPQQVGLSRYIVNIQCIVWAILINEFPSTFEPVSKTLAY